MTTVSQRDGLTLGQALALWMSGREQLVPRDLVYPPDKSKDEIDEANTTDFKQSEDSAEYAALRYLKYPMAVTVENVSDPGPSAGKLQPGDAIDGVNGKPVANLDAVHRAAEEHQARRHARRSTTAARTRRPASPPSRWAPTPTATTDTSGSVCSTRRGRRSPSTSTSPTSADRRPGLMFSLAVVDKLTTGDLNDGKFVAGTGTIDRRRQGRLRSAASRTRCWPPARQARRSSWCPPTTATRPRPPHDDGLRTGQGRQPRPRPSTR